MDRKEVRSSSGAHGADTGARYPGRNTNPRRHGWRRHGHHNLSVHPANNRRRRACGIHVCAKRGPSFRDSDDVDTFRSLVVNTLAGELVPPARRTVVFGMLQGCIMMGQAIGYLSQNTLAQYCG